MEERKGAVTFKGKPLTLIGPELRPGDAAPDCRLVGNDLSAVSLSDFSGKVRVIASVPSLDTAVCDVETRHLNETLGKMGIAVLTVSMDLPFAQKRWCGAAGVENVVTLSDHRNADFGTSYGVLIKGLRLLARAVFVVDGEGTIRYVQLVREMTNEPQYDPVIQVVKELLG